MKTECLLQMRIAAIRVPSWACLACKVCEKGMHPANETDAIGAPSWAFQTCLSMQGLWKVNECCQMEQVQCVHLAGPFEPAWRGFCDKENNAADEIDAIGSARSSASSGEGSSEKDQALLQLLSEMDGFIRDDKVLVMGATNRIDVLDPALLRHGRFDRHIYMGSPSAPNRLAILKVGSISSEQSVL